jgi:hypothetical protein
MTIIPKFQFKFQFQAEGRDETTFPVGSIVDQNSIDLFPKKSFMEGIEISPNGHWVLLFQYQPNFMVLLNLESGASYNVGLHEGPISCWAGPQSLRWVHGGINDIRKSEYFGCSAQRFSVACEHTAGNKFSHPIQFVEGAEFLKFACENEAILTTAKDRQIWFGEDFSAIEAGWTLINRGQPWNFFRMVGDDFVEIVPRGQRQTYICSLQELDAYLKTMASG